MIDLKFSEYFKAIQIPVVCSVVMLAGIVALRMIMSNISILPLFVISVVAGMIIYISFYYIKNPAFLAELKSMLRDK
ncbi:MAG TPA: hypothetical protein ENL09_05730 [Bacteroidetes bacterium]|nr:hypothetical protein [Bacteroidota bacterium]